MTIELLNQYPYLSAKIKRISDQIAKLREEWTVAGAVLSSKATLPYNQREIVIGAVGVDTKRIKQLQAELLQAKLDKAEIEAFINNMPDSKLKEIHYSRFICGDEWADAGASVGMSEKAAIMAVTRYHKKTSVL